MNSINGAVHLVMRKEPIGGPRRGLVDAVDGFNADSGDPRPPLPYSRAAEFEMFALEAIQLRKSYGTHLAVAGVSFRVAPGEVFGLIGPNGAGKSTTMLMLTGLLPPDEGQVRLNGVNFDPNHRANRSQLGMVPQDLALYPDLTALENLRFFGRLYGLRGIRLAERATDVLERTGLAANARELARHFSGGMKRRLNFGIALMHEPRYIILDEPTVGVDPQSRTHLLDTVRDLKQAGVGVIYATHYMEEIEAVCDRVAIVDQGLVLKEGTLDELLNRPARDLRVRLEGLPPSAEAQLQGLAEVSPGTNGDIVLTLRDTTNREGDGLTERLRRVLVVAQANGAALKSVETHENSLEDLFLQLTGRSLRD